jgi:hypothetical protein
MAAVAALAVGFLATSAGSGEVQLYSWTDAEGVIRYTPHRNRVPSSWRSTAEVVQRRPELPDVAAEPPQLISRTPVRDPERASEPALPPESEAAAVNPRDSAPVHEPIRAPAPDPEPIARTAVAEPRVVAQAAVPAPEPDAPAWAVQLSASPIEVAPDPVPAVALPEGTALYRVPAQVDGAAWQRLRLGFFDSSDAAHAAARELDASFPGAWVARVGATERTAMTALVTLPPVAVAPPDLAPRAPAPDPVAKGPALSLARVEAATPATPSPRPIAVLPGVAALGERRFAIQLRSVPLAAGPTPLPLLETAEFRLYRTTVEVEGEVWERLRLGFFDDEKAARRKLAQLGRSFAGAWIVRVSPSEWMLASRTMTGPSDSELPPS